MSMTFDETALLFPGQGAQHLDMFEGIQDSPWFPYRYEAICNVLGSSPLDEGSKPISGEAYLNQNVVSSLVTVLVSSISLEWWRQEYGGNPPYVAGYSVGQWTALYAAGCLSFETLVLVIQKRAQVMDECFVNRRGAMIAIIGVCPEDVQAFCDDLSSKGKKMVISNYNSYGQYTLAGSQETVEYALKEIDRLNPKMVRELPMRNAWHCWMLESASEKFLEWVNTLELKEPQIRVINNVTGDFFSTNISHVKVDLAKHLSLPVLWEQGIKKLIASGCKTLFEIGYGNTLTKFGVFIDRTVSHKAYYSPLSA